MRIHRSVQFEKEGWEGYGIFMSIITLYHNSDCSKSRWALEELQNAQVPFRIRYYLESPLSEGEIGELLTCLKLQPEQLVRRGEDQLTDLGYEENTQWSSEKWIKILAENPILIERPILSDGKTAVIGRPPEKVRQFLDSL